MYRVEAKLAQWKRVYLDLGAAHERLSAAVDRSEDQATLQALRADVARLQQASADALKAVQTQIDNAKPKMPDQSAMWIGELEVYDELA